MNKLAQLRAALKAKAEELKVLSAKEDYSAEDGEKAEALKTELETLKAEITAITDRDANKELADTYAEFLTSTQPVAEVQEPATQGLQNATVVARTVPATYSAVRLNNIKGEVDGLSAHQRAYNFGMWALAAFGDSAKAREYCKQNGFMKLAHMEGDNAKGGWLVPDEVSRDIIDLRDEYGVFRQFANVRPMTSDHKSFRLRKGDLEAYPIGEGGAFTESEADYGEFEMTARKWGVLARNSSELDEDTFISWADEMAGNIARAFAYKEDMCGFYGDGTSAYHRIKGVIPTLVGLDGTVGNVSALQEASGNEWSEIALKDLVAVTGRVRSRYVRSARLTWYCSQQFYTTVMVNLALAAGGNAAGEVVNGVTRNTFLGYPVVITDVLPRAEANSQVACLFGSLRDAVAFGDRKGIAIAMSEHDEFKNDMIVWRGRERFDINVWNVGNATATPADREYGPIVGLITKPS